MPHGVAGNPPPHRIRKTPVLQLPYPAHVVSPVHKENPLSEKSGKNNRKKRVVITEPHIHLVETPKVKQQPKELPCDRAQRIPPVVVMINRHVIRFPQNFQIPFHERGKNHVHEQQLLTPRPVFFFSSHLHFPFSECIFTLDSSRTKIAEKSGNRKHRRHRKHSAPFETPFQARSVIKAETKSR